MCCVEEHQTERACRGGEQRLTIATKKKIKNLTQFKQSDSHRYKQTRQGERERGVCVLCVCVSPPARARQMNRKGGGARKWAVERKYVRNLYTHTQQNANSTLWNECIILHMTCLRRGHRPHRLSNRNRAKTHTRDCEGSTLRWSYWRYASLPLSLPFKATLQQRDLQLEQTRWLAIHHEHSRSNSAYPGSLWKMMPSRKG